MALTSAQIVTQATQICRVPGMVSQAGQQLNAILGDLCQTYDFDTIRETTTLNVTSASASYALPADFLRTREVFYSINGSIFWVTPFNNNMADYDQMFQGPGINNYPEKYATQVEISPVLMWFWPPPNIPLAITVRYQGQQPDIAVAENSTTVPWFTNQRFLIKRLTADLGAMAGDQRAQTWSEEADHMLRNYLAMSDDKEGRSMTVPLDPNRFRVTANLKPTKITVW